MENPPGGVSFELTADGFRLGASCRSFVDAIMRIGLAGVVSSLPFVLWWDLIRGFWSDEGFSFWATAVFLTVWAGGIAYADTVAIMSVLGVIRVTKAGGRGEIFAGVGKLGWTHRFQWSDFERADGSEVRIDSEEHSGKVRYIVLRGSAKPYKFGWQLPSERQDFVIDIVNRLGFAHG